MAWVAVDFDGAELVYRVQPFRGKIRFKTNSECVELPKGSLRNLLEKSCLGKMRQQNLNKNNYG